MATPENAKIGGDAAAPAVVLVEPQLAVNIGMAARAMANFGLSDLRLVRPRDGWPSRGRLPKGALEASAGAHGVLQAATLHDDVRSATADLGTVFATTARQRGQVKPVVGPREAALRLREEAAPAGLEASAARRGGFLFGRERAGLDNDAISLADAIVTFPVDPAFASLNLAQAVLLVGYEWRACLEAAPRFTGEPRSGPPKKETIHALFGALEAHLDARGYFVPENKRDVMTRNLRNILHRLGGSEAELRTLRGVIDRLATLQPRAEARNRDDG